MIKVIASFTIQFAFLGSILMQDSSSPVRKVSDRGVITTGQRITPAGAQSVFAGQVFGVTFGESSDALWVLTDRNVYELSRAGNRVLTNLPYPSFAGLQGIQFDQLAHSPLLSSAITVARSVDEAERLNRLHDTAQAVARLCRVRGRKIEIVADNLGKHITGALAVARSENKSGQHIAVVPLTAENHLAIVDLKTNRVLGLAETGIAPFAAALNDEGTVAYVSNWGGRVPLAGELTGTTGVETTSDRVVVDERGIAASGTITRIDISSRRATHNIIVGLHPTALALDESRHRLYIANGNSDTVSIIDTNENRVGATIRIEPFREHALGLAPTALALTGDSARLFVVCGGINAVAVYDTTNLRLLGLIPTAWYPNSLSISPDGKVLAVGALLGAGSGAQEGDDTRRKRSVFMFRGSLSVLTIPSDVQLESYTRAVAANNHLHLANLSSTSTESETVMAAQTSPLPVPRRPGEPSLIDHVVLIIKENRTYDQVFGDLGRGNGDPSLVMYGRNITPNHHRLAEQFVLLDNYYATGSISANGHQWLTQANETDYTMWSGYEGRSYPFDGTDPIAYSSGGFLWDAGIRKGKTVKVFGEFAGRIRNPPVGQRLKLLEEWRRGNADFTNRFNTTAPLAPLNKILAKDYPAYGSSVPDVVRTQIFLSHLKQWEQDGSMPNLVIVQLPSDHTAGTRPGYTTPAAAVADNDLALGQIVESLTRSSFWKKMAIFAVEDDAQDGVDHVDGHRTVALAISPYTKRGSIDSTFYAHQNLLKTIELMLGLEQLSIYDLVAEPMSRSFGENPDYSSYTAVTPKQSITEANPPLSALKGQERQAALASLRMRFDIPDAAPEDTLNRILWHTGRGWTTRYPLSRAAAFSPLSIDFVDKGHKEQCKHSR